MLTTSVSRKAGHSGGRSATSSQFLCAAVIIARFTAVAMKPRGGKRLELIRRLPLASCGWTPTLCQRNDGGAQRPDTGRQNPNYETKPIETSRHDVIQANRGQSTKCAQEHGADNGRRKTTLASQRRSPWADRRDCDHDLEDEEDYKAFELSVTSGFDAPTAVERELVLRLASLLWRLRRATAIDTGLLQLQSDTLLNSSARMRHMREVTPSSTAKRIGTRT